MTKYGFIKNWEILQEDYRESSCGFENEANKLSEYLDNLPSSKNAIIGFVGKFGTGKSALLEEVKKLRKKKKEKWWQFDAWKYQDKGGLWKSFLLDFVDENKGWRISKILRRNFIGKRYFFWQAFMVLLSGSVGIYLNKINFIPDWGIAFLSLVGVFFANVIYDFPIDHISELQKEFIKYIERDENGKLFIILEDIDRANTAGVHFLETISFLLRKEINNKRVIVIANMGNDGFNSNISSCFKCLDYIYFSQLPSPDMYKFVDDVFDEKLFSTDGIFREQIVRFLVELNNLPDGSIRKIKLLLRDSTAIYENLDRNRYDWRIVVAFVATKYFKYIERGSGMDLGTFAERYKKSSIERNDVFGRLFLAILNNSGDLNYEPGEKIIRFVFGGSVNSKVPVRGPNFDGFIGAHYKDILITN